MTLHLIVNNKLSQRRPTCRNNCELFDDVTEKCGVGKRFDPDKPETVVRCGDMIYKKREKTIRFTLIEDLNDFTFNDEELLHSIVSEPIKKDSSKYPEHPDLPSNRSDACWYVSPDGTFGCWIINKSKKAIMAVSKTTDVKKGWHKNVYSSPIPLHDHKASLQLSSKIAWLIDHDGYGQYVLLSQNGKISYISSPKPVNWKPE